MLLCYESISDDAIHFPTVWEEVSLTHWEFTFASWEVTLTDWGSAQFFGSSLGGWGKSSCLKLRYGPGC